MMTSLSVSALTNLNGPEPIGMPRHFISAAVGHNADRAIGEIPQQGGVRLFHVKYHGEVIRRIEVIHEAIGRRLGTANLSGKQGIEGPLHIARGERTPVVKLHAVMKVKDVGQRIGNLPALGQSRRDIQVVAAREQIVEDQVVDAFGLRIDCPRVDPDSWGSTR